MIFIHETFEGNVAQNSEAFHIERVVLSFRGAAGGGWDGCGNDVQYDVILLMEEILHHLGCIESCK